MVLNPQRSKNHKQEPCAKSKTSKSGSCTTCRLHAILFMLGTLFWAEIGSYNHRLGYPQKGVWHEPTSSSGGPAGYLRRPSTGRCPAGCLHECSGSPPVARHRCGQRPTLALHRWWWCGRLHPFSVHVFRTLQVAAATSFHHSRWLCFEPSFCFF